MCHYTIFIMAWFKYSSFQDWFRGGADSIILLLELHMFRFLGVYMDYVKSIILLPLPSTIIATVLLSRISGGALLVFSNYHLLVDWLFIDCKFSMPQQAEHRNCS